MSPREGKMAPILHYRPSSPRHRPLASPSGRQWVNLGRRWRVSFGHHCTPASKGRLQRRASQNPSSALLDVSKRPRMSLLRAWWQLIEPSVNPRGAEGTEGSREPVFPADDSLTSKSGDHTPPTRVPYVPNRGPLCPRQGPLTSPQVIDWRTSRRR